MLSTTSTVSSSNSNWLNSHFSSPSPTNFAKNSSKILHFLWHRSFKAKLYHIITTFLSYFGRFKFAEWMKDYLSSNLNHAMIAILKICLCNLMVKYTQLLLVFKSKIITLFILFKFSMFVALLLRNVSNIIAKCCVSNINLHF